ncbi:MAG: hypothetical protein QOH10_2313, partial [Actinomycetota bacterium]|nr:hypothetical protein [Actinomycetota bacterium]
MTTSTSRARFAAVALAIGAAVTSVPATAASAAPATLTLASAPAWIAPGGDLHLHVRLSGPTAGLLLRVSAHPAITSRTAFSDTLAGADAGRVVDDVSIAVAYLPRARNGETIVPVGLQDPGEQRDVRRLAVEHTGVYPLTVSLSPPNADPVATIETWLVVAERALDTRLSFAWVWQLVGTPRTSDNEAQVRAAVDPDGRLGRAAQALDGAGNVPLSFVLGPETFQTWAGIASRDTRAAAGLAEVRTAVADETRRQVLATPYVPLNLPSIAAAGMAGEFVRDLRVGADAIQSVLGVLPDPRTVLLDPIDAAAIHVARDAFAQRLVVREEAVRPVAHVLTPARQFGIESAGRVYPAAASSTFVDHLLDGPGSRAERAQRFLAGLSLIALEAPSIARGIVLATPAEWNPDPNLTAMVLAGLRSNPFIHPTTLDGYFAAVP